MTGRKLALASFWSERPLVALYRAASGQEEFSLKQLIAFAETLPNAMIEKMWGDASQAPPLSSRPQGDRLLPRSLGEPSDQSAMTTEFYQPSHKETSHAITV